MRLKRHRSPYIIMYVFASVILLLHFVLRGIFVITVVVVFSYLFVVFRSTVEIQ